MQDDFFLKFHFKNRVKLVAAKKRYKTVEIRQKRTYQRHEEKTGVTPLIQSEIILPCI